MHKPNDFRAAIVCFTATIAFIITTSLTHADPCGMVPPISSGNQSQITRIGLQKTYVFHKDGVETFVIRPGFEGNIDNFGMLIPFPNPPELRKVGDNIFEHVANAVDPPEVVVDLRIRRRARGGGINAMATAEDSAAQTGMMLRKNQVNVLKEEAVGMYEVAVLSAGSAEALQKWMDKNGYQYPEGMDSVTEDYIEQEWCFVAVKTRVGEKSNVQPRPGQRNAETELPDGSVFDGHVQGMGFRFKSEQLVVPMRLSAFNEGDLRNVVYILADGPRKIRAIPEEYVVRQISGEQLYKNVTEPLPLRVIGGTEQDIPRARREQLVAERDPQSKNGLARELFASDLLAVSSGNLSLEHEETEKGLLVIGERLGLRGPDVDRENSQALQEQRDQTVAQGLEMLKEMTLSVVDGDFPREAIASDNLHFAEYSMPAELNDNLKYDSRLFGPGQKREGNLYIGSVDWQDVDRQVVARHSRWRFGSIGLVCLGLIGLIGTFYVSRSKTVVCLLVAVLCIGASAAVASAQEDGGRAPTQDDAMGWLAGSETAQQGIDWLKTKARVDSERDEIVGKLVSSIRTSENLEYRGWAVIALSEIGGQDVDEHLLGIHADENQQMLVRTWCAAARVAMTRTTPGLIEKANLISTFPALGRPIGIRLVEKLQEDGSSAGPEDIVQVSVRVPQLQEALIPTIIALGPEQLTGVMLGAGDVNTRRMAAGYLGTVAGQQNDLVTETVISSLKFDSQEDDVPWSGADDANTALFLPGISWGKADAQQLVGQLIRWYVWCDANGKTNQLRQIHNNIRSVNLARSAGYQSPGWNDISSVQWLQAWSDCMGKEEVRAILEEQNLLDSEKYADILK